MSSADVPFVLRGGNDQMIALHNRISAIERIKHLSGVDLRNRSTSYKQLIDCELYVRFYKDAPKGTQIDEEFCQRVAEVVKTLESEKADDLAKMEQGATERVEKLFEESKMNIPQATVEQPLEGT